MNIRSSRSIVTYPSPFTLSGYPDELPAGAYEILVEEELLQGLSFSAYRRTGAYLTVPGLDDHGGHSEIRRISDADLELALTLDRRHKVAENDNEAVLFPPEDLT
ncbi:MAG: hypothetical protein CMO29_21955 [Tistrella sp.]|mgnify:CR=1 FL=1|nr:hypothetical protein [uncultured Tistrella sp.]MAM76463.1 hypothetical protein [Tistrella sp.]